ncbi:MAG: TetR/AcrR family transcriptional regulator [Thermoanaerobaculia bacterium]|nr:TetR/AcrR family transcriptional regulator [Thermoanaerobaculia bacterium]
MPRTSDPDLPATVDRLRAAAVELFAERGYAGASMGELADRVGIAKASLYNYYPSKEALLVDLLERAHAEWNAATTALLDAPGTAAERIRRYFAAVFDVVERAPQVVAVLRIATSMLPEDPGGRVRALVEADRARSLEAARRVLAEGVAAGEIAPADLDDLLLFGEVFLNGIILAAAGCADLTEPLRRRRAALWHLFWHGLAGRPYMENRPS